MTDNEHVLFEEIPGKGGNLGLITLNRPDALNALTHDMCQQLNQHLKEWEMASKIKAVVICGAGEKAFSAGGDLVQLYEAGKAGKLQQVQDFFRDEYRLNYRIHHYSKPFISLLDGITMGGGVGVSIHGSHRVVTERFVFAMPETSIGFFPDIGGSYFLSRCPGETGVYLGLTGMKLNAAEAIYVNLTDHFISSNHLDELVTIIAAQKFGDDPAEAVSDILTAVSVRPEMPELATFRENIDTCFAMDSVEEIIENLKQHDKPWHQETVKILQQKSPLSLKVTLREIRDGVSMDFESCMQMEFRLCQHFMRGQDFYEGIRAVLIDKDKKPTWHPDRLEDVTGSVVDSYFAFLAEGELTFE
jgi:enoyl-CoA hydratase